MLTSYVPGNKRKRKVNKASESPDSMSSPHSTPPRRRSVEDRFTAAQSQTDAMLDEVRRIGTRGEGEKDQNPAPRKQMTPKPQLAGRSKNRVNPTAVVYQESEGLTARRDRVIEEKNLEIDDLREQLADAQGFQAASRMALDTRNNELETLKVKHNKLIKAAETVTVKWGWFEELVDAVNEVTD